MANRTKMTALKKEEFLNALRKFPNVTKACRAIGVSRNAVYAHKNEDAEFSLQWEEALEEAIDTVEEEALKRGLSGQSDTLLIFMLKALRPDKFKERSETKQVHDGSIKVVYIDDWRNNSPPETS